MPFQTKLLLCEKEVASILGCSIYKLQKDRLKGSPIPFIKIGRAVRYRPQDVEAYLQSQQFTSTSQYTGGAND